MEEATAATPAETASYVSGQEANDNVMVEDPGPQQLQEEPRPRNDGKNIMKVDDDKLCSLFGRRRLWGIVAAIVATALVLCFVLLASTTRGGERRGRGEEEAEGGQTKNTTPSPVTLAPTVTFQPTPVPMWLQLGSDLEVQAIGASFGDSLAMSSDGRVIVIGAFLGDPNDNNLGKVHVLEFVSGVWSQRGAPIAGQSPEDKFGVAVDVSSNGSIVAASSHFAYSSSQVAPDGSNIKTGHVQIYSWDGAAWTALGNTIDGVSVNDRFGSSLSLSSDGMSVAVGAPGYNANGTDVGHAIVFVLQDNPNNNNNKQWIQRGRDLVGKGSRDNFGYSVSMSGDGSIVAVGAAKNGFASGHIRVFRWTTSDWVQLGSDVLGENTLDNLDHSMALSRDGSTIALGAPRNRRGNRGARGSCRVWSFDGTNWVQKGPDIDGEALMDRSGTAVGLSADGSVVIVSAQSNQNSAGHARIFRFVNNAWVQVGVDLDGRVPGNLFGQDVAISDDGSIAAVSGLRNGNNQNTGHVRVFQFA